jgi:putative FmdB family regulatory protein
MPLYDYQCDGCGPFREWRRMSDYAQPATCPDCGSSAERLMATPVIGMDSGLRRAHATNERSAHEPRVVRRRRGDAIPQHDAHADLMRVREERAAKRREPRKKETVVSKHRWMVGH